MSSEQGAGLPSYWSDPSWIVAVPGLSRSKADEVVALLNEHGVSFGVSTFSPRKAIQLILDRSTAAVLLAAIADSEGQVYRVQDSDEDEVVFSLEHIAGELQEFVNPTPPAVSRLI
ncbi:hypothetical protein GCM10022287_17690 [Gryllotalpicola koreensis]|uniref:Uncharacterized protein n=1 Tax=Gryllotalpicola koreensis TaxID=993086 RepID=A0ABP7ZZG5_9MICO